MIQFRFGCRKITLLSLYLSILSSVVCAIVANFATLLLARALIGFAIGLNFSIHNVMIGKLASNKANLDEILMISTPMYSLGGVWSAVLGYLLLEVMGWRTFVLVTSLPVFIPPIAMLHCYLQDESEPEIKDEREEIIPNETQTTVPNYVARVTKIGMFTGTCAFTGLMTILLVPSLIQLLKIKESGTNTDCSVTVTQGAEFLLLGLVTSASVPGRVFIHFVRKKISFRKRQVLVSLVKVGCFVWMLLQENLAVAVTTNFIVMFLFGATAMESAYIVYDKSYFGTTGFALGCSIATAGGKMGSVGGLALVAFVPPFYAMICAAVISAIQIPVVFSMTEVQI